MSEKPPSVARQACTVLEEKDPEKRNGSTGFVGSARRTIAVLGFLVTAGVGVVATTEGNPNAVWGEWPFVVAFIVTILALPLGEVFRALRQSDPSEAFDKFADLVGKLRGSGGMG